MSDYSISTANIEIGTAEHPVPGIINDYIDAYTAGRWKADKVSYLMKCRAVGIAIPDSVIRYANAFNPRDIRIPDMNDWYVMLTTENVDKCEHAGRLIEAVSRASLVNDAIMRRFSDDNMLAMITIRMLALYFVIRNLPADDGSDNSRAVRTRLKSTVDTLAMFIADTADSLIDEPPAITAHNAVDIALSEAAGVPVTDALDGGYTRFQPVPVLMDTGADLSEIIIRKLASSENIVNSLPDSASVSIAPPASLTKLQSSNADIDEHDATKSTYMDRGYLYD